MTYQTAQQWCGAKKQPGGATQTKMKKLIAFHGDPAVKAFYLERVRAHRAADEIIQGSGWDGRKGCAVGCTLNKYDHFAYEAELGVPMILARLQDGIHENIPFSEAALWPEQFLQAISVGADLSTVWPKMAIWLMEDPEFGVLQFAKSDAAKKVNWEVANGYRRELAGEKLGTEFWRALRRASASASAADAAAAAYASASASASASAASAAAAAYASASAAAAAYASASASAADADAAADAASYSASASAYAAADADARLKFRLAQRDKLIVLLSEAI